MQGSNFKNLVSEKATGKEMTYRPATAARDQLQSSVRGPVDCQRLNSLRRRRLPGIGRLREPNEFPLRVLRASG